MQEQWLHEKSAAPWDVTFHFAKFESACGLHVAREPSKEMRPRNDAKRPIVRSAVVEVQTNRDQILQYVCWGLNERAPFFDVPPSKATPIYSGFYGDTQILMYGDEPIDVGILVEIRALHGDKGTQELL